MTGPPHDAYGTPEFYGYPLSQKIITYLLMPLVSLTSIGLGAFLLTAGGAIVGTVLVLSGAWFFFLSAFGLLMCSSIVVSNHGIGARNFGRTLKSIRWEDVTKIKKVRRWNAGSRSYDDAFYVFHGDFPALRERMVNLRGPIVFSDKILKLRDLLDKINEFARHHHFLLVTLDQETPRNVTTQKEAISLGQTSPKVDETEVAEF